MYSEDYANWLESASLEIEAKAEAYFERSVKYFAERHSKYNPDWYKLPDENEPNTDTRKSMPTDIDDYYLLSKRGTSKGERGFGFTCNRRIRLGFEPRWV